MSRDVVGITTAGADSMEYAQSYDPDIQVASEPSSMIAKILRNTNNGSGTPTSGDGTSGGGTS